MIVRVPIIAAQWYPIFRRSAGQIILRKVGPIDWSCVVIAEHGNATDKAAPSQHFRRGKADPAATNDDEALGSSSGRNRCRLLFLAGDRDPALTLFDLPAVNRTQCRRRQRFTGREAEAGMMPGTANSVAHDQAFGERSMIVRAMGGDCRNFAAVPHQEDFLTADMTGKHLTFHKSRSLDALREVEP